MKHFQEIQKEIGFFIFNRKFVNVIFNEIIKIKLRNVFLNQRYIIFFINEIFNVFLVFKLQNFSNFRSEIRHCNSSRNIQKVHHFHEELTVFRNKIPFQKLYQSFDGKGQIQRQAFLRNRFNVSFLSFVINFQISQQLRIIKNVRIASAKNRDVRKIKTIIQTFLNVILHFCHRFIVENVLGRVFQKMNFHSSFQLGF